MTESAGRRGATCILLACALVLVTCSSTGCSLPNLEKPQCTEARDAIRHFYSFHFGGDMLPTPENIRSHEPYLTDELFRTLSSPTNSEIDYFTGPSPYPRAFRIGSCTAATDDKVIFQVLLLWRDDTATDQKERHVEMLRVGGKWLVNKVTS